MQSFIESPAKTPQRPQKADRPYELAAVVHELCERLTAISAYLETACRLLGYQATLRDGELAEILGKSSAQADRACEVFRQFQALVRPDDGYPAETGSAGASDRSG